MRVCVRISPSAAVAVQLVLTSSLTHPCRTQENGSVFLCYSSPYSLEAGSLWEHEVLPFCWRTWLASKLLPLPSNAGTAGRMWLCLPFLQVVGFSTQGLILVY